MKSSKCLLKQRATKTDQSPTKQEVDHTISSPNLSPKKSGKSKRSRDYCTKIPLDIQSASETQLTSPSFHDEARSPDQLHSPIGDRNDPELLNNMERSRSVQDTRKQLCRSNTDCDDQKRYKDKAKCYKQSKTHHSHTLHPTDSLDSLTRQIRDIHNDARKSTRIIRDSRARLLEIQKKTNITEADVKELGERNELLLREMERFDRMTRHIQQLVGADMQRKRDSPLHMEYLPGSIYEPPVHHEMRMGHPTILLTSTKPSETPGLVVCEPPIRSKSEIDLTRKLSESYDMQEKLAADNADLEVKRYILYKELMTKDQNLETCRAQIKRLQGELKLMNKENSLLNEKLSKNNPEGDAASLKQETPCQDTTDCEQDVSLKQSEELISKLENYKTASLNLEKQLGSLEADIYFIKTEMDKGKIPPPGSACRSAGGGPNTCYQQPTGGPPAPPMTKACGVCPPCPAPCNPNAPPTPAEREVQKLTIQLKQTEDSFKVKVAECAVLRAELLKKKEELEKERCLSREVQNKLRELEMKFEGLTMQTNMNLGTKEQAFEKEASVSALKQCYREAREEIEELRMLMKEQNDQLQDYRVKYLQTQQVVEEQKRQMDMMDMDNTRISEQINLEIQKVKLKFQEKLQELAPIPDLLKATQMRLKDAQQAQALAEHNAEQLARELNCAREKVHMLLHSSVKQPEKAAEKVNADEKQIQLLQQRVTQLTEANSSFKQEIDRLKNNIIRMEEAVLANEKRLQEKMHECAQMGGELDRARDDAARALQRANERTETVRKCMQTTIAEMERQLAATRAQVKVSEKEREELQYRMKCQITRLNENFEQAQLRIMGLQQQVATLRRTASSTGEGEGDQQECACRTFFDSP